LAYSTEILTHLSERAYLEWVPTYIRFIGKLSALFLRNPRLGRLTTVSKLWANIWALTTIITL